MTLVIGLTGSIGTGKSTVSKYIKSLNIPLVDADLIAREVVEPGEVAYEKIKSTFGQEVFHEDGRLNREALGHIIFNDKGKREQLNAIVHPEIRKKMLAQRNQAIKAEEKCVVMDIPLLFESGLTDFVEKIIVVATDEATQLERLMNRDQANIDVAQSRIKSQIPITSKIEKADAVIDNNGSLAETYAQIEKILKNWKVLS